jgi:hypothetical protein
MGGGIQAIQHDPTPFAFDFKQAFDEKEDPFLLK